MVNAPSVVEIYPREGTETLAVRLQSLAALSLKLIPDRGTETTKGLTFFDFGRAEIYPREGTETYGSSE